MRSTAAIAAATVVIALGARAQSVTVVGPDGRSRAVSAAELATMPHASVVLVGEHGPSRRYDGVPLTLLVESVGAPVGKALRGAALADTVTVTAADGYAVVLALSDTDPGMTDRKTVLADRVEGAPLPATEGPFRLVVEGDLRPARAARMVTTIRVRAPDLPAN